MVPAFMKLTIQNLFMILVQNRCSVTSHGAIEGHHQKVYTWIAFWLPQEHLLGTDSYGYKKNKFSFFKKNL